MARLFLHIGAHKTATSYVQGLFDHNRRELAAAGLYYPLVGPNNAHHALAASWIDMPDLPADFFGTGGPDALWEKAVIQPYASQPGTVFLSAENFSRFHPKRVDMADLAKRLEVFEDVKIIYTVRSQVEMLASLWAQVAKTRKAPTIKSYLERVFATGMGGGVSLDHHAVYHHLRTGFAPDQIILLDYHKICENPGGVAQTFLDLMGIPLSVAHLAAPPPDTRNVSPDFLSFWLASQICRDGPPPDDLVALVTAILHPDGMRPTTVLSQREYNKIRSKFRDGNALLSEAVAQLQPEFRFDPPPAPENLMYRDQLPPHVWPQIAATLWEESRKSGLRSLLSRAVGRLMD